MPKTTLPALANELAGTWSITADDSALAVWLHMWFTEGDVPMAGHFAKAHSRACAWWQAATEEQQHAAWTLLGLTEYNTDSLSEQERLSVPKRVLDDLKWVLDETQRVLTQDDES